MNTSFAGIAAAMIAGTALALGAPAAMAGNVNWSVNIGTPGVIYGPPVVYAPPPAVYAPPPVVYVRPQPVYVQPAPVVSYGQVYYEQPYYRSYPPGRGHWKHRHHRHDD